MRSIVLFIAVVLSVATASAQISPEEAKAKLAERDAKRLAERNQMVQISAGELADLRAKVLQLEATVKSLQAQQGKATAKRMPETIEIGMTKDEVIAFVKAHGTLRITGISAAAGIQRSSVQTTVRRGSTAKREVANDDAPARRTQTAMDDKSKEEVETVRDSGKRETIHISRYGRYSEQNGTQRDSLGGIHPVYQNVDRVDGTITVTLVDDLVTAVTAN